MPPDNIGSEIRRCDVGRNSILADRSAVIEAGSGGPSGEHLPPLLQLVSLLQHMFEDNIAQSVSLAWQPFTKARCLA